MIVRITDLDDRNINVEVEDDIDTNYVINKATCQVFAKGTSIVISFWNPRDRNLSATQLVYDESIVEEPIHTDVDDLVAKVNAFLATGITAINAITEAAQTLEVGTTGTDFAISSSGSAHTFNLPTASASNRGALSSANWTTFNGKQDSSLSPLRIKNRWHIPSEVGFSLATGSLVLNNIYALAVRFTEETTITDIGFIATSGVPGALANIGIYDSNSLGEPNNLVASASNINITSSGSKSVTLGSPVVLPVGKYWFAIFSSATISVTSSGISSLAGIGNATLVATTVTAILKGLTFTALPNPFGAYSTTNQANVPFVWFKNS